MLWPAVLFLVILALTAVPHFIFAAVVVNEIAWMGSLPKGGETATQAANNEWLEFFNDGAAAVDLTGWRLDAADGTPAILLSGSISGGGFFLLERTDDETVPGIVADLIYTGALSNSGETLVLKDAAGNAVHTVDASGGWPAGDNGTKDTMQRSGADWITASPMPRAQNSSSATTPPPPAPAGSPPPPPAGTPVPAPPPGGGIPSTPGASGGALAPKSSLGAEAGSDMAAIAGAVITFRGMAYGLNGEVLDTARHLWNFGDGSTQEGKAVTHVYHFPGSYRVNLSVSSGEYAGSDWFTVTVVPPRLIVSEAKPGGNGFVEIYNGSDQAVDLAGLLLTDNFEKTFRIPPRTAASAGGAVVVPNITSGLNPVSTLTLGDARGLTLDAASFPSGLPAGGSWEWTGEGFVNSSVPTPGQYAPTPPAGSQPVAVRETPPRNQVLPPAVPKAEERPPADAGVPPPLAAVREAVEESALAAAAANISPRLFVAAGVILSALAAAALVFLKRMLP